MRINHKALVSTMVFVCAAWPAAALAQAPGDDLMAMGKEQLRGEIQQRYAAALALTNDQAVVAANDPRFTWASQAKAQCGIALGFLKSSYKDPVSIGKCADAALRMAAAPPPPAVVMAPPPPAVCNKGPYIVFFDWDKSDVTPDAATILDSAVAAISGCGGAPIFAAGYTDSSGGPEYNQRLSENRAEAVRSYFVGHGVAGTLITTQGFGETNPRVPTADGVRELQNRRVEITVK
jgi:outer membrane protein OmpA-like peptidoglycan-associated protein